MTSTATATRTALQVGESRDFPVADGRYVIAVTRVDIDAWRVVVLDAMTGLSIPCYTVCFDSTAGNLPVGMSGKRAAWEYMQQRIQEFEQAAERPADVSARVAADYAAQDLKRIPAPQQTALRRHRDGVVHKGAGVTVTMLRALAKAHLGRVVYRTTGMRRSVVAVELNRHGRRLADHLNNTIAA